MSTYGTSTWCGKGEIKNFLLSKLQPNDKILDVGAGGGTYYNLLGKNYNWSAVEIWHETVQHISQFYNKVYEGNIIDFWYPEEYDLVIFGDVLEHLSVKDAQECVERAKLNSKAIMIAIPYRYKQNELYGNEAERHIQDDLTPEIFDERYPGFQRIFNNDWYAYYYWHKEES